MNPLEKLMKLIAESGFTVAVKGRELALTIAGQVMNNPPDFYLSSWTDSKGEQHLSASLTAQEAGIDGFKKNVRYEYDPEAEDDNILTEVEAAAAVDLSTLDENQARHIVMAFQGRSEELTAEIEARFKDFVSPGDVQKKIDAALAEANKDGGSTMDKDEVGKIVDAKLQTQANDSSVLETRLKAAEAAGVTITDERRGAILAFTTDEAGSKAFTTWLAGELTAQEAMTKDLESAGVTVDENVAAAIAPLGGVSTAAFDGLKRVLTASKPQHTSRFGNLAPAMGGEDALSGDDVPYL